MKQKLCSLFSWLLSAVACIALSALVVLASASATVLRVPYWQQLAGWSLHADNAASQAAAFCQIACVQAGLPATAADGWFASQTVELLCRQNLQAYLAGKPAAEATVFSGLARHLTEQLNAQEIALSPAQRKALLQLEETCNDVVTQAAAVPVTSLLQRAEVLRAEAPVYAIGMGVILFAALGVLILLHRRAAVQRIAGILFAAGLACTICPFWAGSTQFLRALPAYTDANGLLSECVSDLLRLTRTGGVCLLCAAALTGAALLAVHLFSARALPQTDLLPAPASDLPTE